MSQSKINDFYPGDIPAAPGIYIFRDIFDKIIYIGKAVNLRKRMSQYFYLSRRSTADPKLRSLIKSISSWEFREVKTEAEALLLESQLIKQYSPHYNILMRDDKRYFLVKLNVNAKFPKLSLARIRKNDECSYYGPFPHGTVLRQTVEFLSGYFKLRQCGIENPTAKDRKYCMEAKVKLCCEPCIGKVSENEYKDKIKALTEVLDGKADEITSGLKEQMSACAEACQFERAALLRDVIENITTIFGRKGRSFRFASIPARSTMESIDSLKRSLGLSKPPCEIEAFDISNAGEDYAVAGMVSFSNGLPDKKNYRRFRIKTVSGINDFEMMHEVVMRRYARVMKENHKMPDLIIVDGGKGQLSSAIRALVALGAPPLPVIGLAKRNEEVFVPGRSEPILLSADSPALKLIQAVRDEAHRFAVSYNRDIRLRRIQESVLDDIPGIGIQRKTALLKAFSSVREIRNASPEEIVRKVPMIGMETAKRILASLNPERSRHP